MLDKDLDVFKEENQQTAFSSGELVIGTIVGINDNGLANLKYAGLDGDVSAQSTVTINAEHIGRQVAVMFINQDLKQPIIMGLIRSKLDELLDAMSVTDLAEVEPSSEEPESESKEETTEEIKNVQVDGKKITIEGRDEIVFKCGESSITLTKAGKILIRGKYLLNRSSGVNRIMGGSVQVN